MNARTRTEKLIKENSLLRHKIKELEQFRIDPGRTREVLKSSGDIIQKALYINPDTAGINRLEDGLFVSVNPAFMKYTGYTEEVIGKTSIECNIWVDMKDRQRLLEGLERNGEVRDLEVFFRMKNGEKRRALMSASALELDGVPHHLFISRDITEREQVKQELQQMMERLAEAMGSTVQVMVALVETRDPYTAIHQVRSTNLACAIAAEMGLDRERINGIRMAGSIHDVGKLSIPVEILTKPKRLTNLEEVLVKTHPRKGYEILMNLESSWPLAEIVHQHHERMDGSGYPRNLQGNDILAEARIIAVSDVVEAMASHRPYRPSLGLEPALREIVNNRGKLYDADVVDVCLKLFRSNGYLFSTE
jgi:PAS domain S-box-containing protein